MKIVINKDKDLDIKSLMRKYGISRATAYRAVTRGYFYPEYHKKRVCIADPCTFDVANAYTISKAVFHRYFHPKLLGWKEDMIQEAVLRMLEVSGISQDKKFFWSVARNAMRDYARKNRLIESREILI